MTIKKPSEFALKILQGMKKAAQEAVQKLREAGIEPQPSVPAPKESKEH